MKPFICASYILTSLLVTRESAIARRIPGESVLCKNRNLTTMIALSTAEYNTAICKELGDAYHYVSQNKRNLSQIFLPIVQKNNPYSGANPWLLKARQGAYTYQIAEFNPLRKNSYVSTSIFRNGERIYHQVTRTYLGANE
jgi:hypothetical protein